jgi:hypothetical protein
MSYRFHCSDRRVVLTITCDGEISTIEYPPP